MNIRKAETNDIPSIVELLKLSLGEELLPKSEAYWRWKHVDNPFGMSPVLLAFEKDLLVGVRAFMRWKWQNGQDVYQAVRAVDTATHPAHQGKGIFKKLTLMLVDQCQKEGVNFVFNTPNSSSKPGYLKMGWEEAGKLPVTIRCRRPFSVLLHASGLKVTGPDDYSENSLSYFLDSPGLAELLLKNSQQQTSISTQHSVESICWRYKHVEVVKYFAAGLERDGRLLGLVIYRIKPGKGGSEFRITDIFLQSIDYRREVVTLIAERINLHNAEFMTVSASYGWIVEGIFTLPALNVGPVVTVRDLINGPLNKLRGFRAWAPSTGDLELF